MMNVGKFVIVNDAPGFMGSPQFITDSFKTLKKGDLIVQIGAPGKNGGETSSHRIDKYSPAIEFCGIMQLPEIEESWAEGSFIAFKVPEGQFTRDIFSQSGELYVLYAICDCDENWLFKTRFKLLNCFSYSSDFLLQE